MRKIQKKLIDNLFILCLLWFMPFTLSSQRTVSGRITDASDKGPVPGVTVFIANTSVATVTDVDGRYRLAIPGEGSYRLTVSHVGYQPVSKDIEPGNASITFDVALLPHELAEVTVATKVRFRQKDINLFWNTILGQNPSKKTIQATNPEAVYYYYNAETRILKVTCRVPLHIVNHTTGYDIQYLLDYFTHDYNTGITDWSFQSFFTELEPANIRQQKSWEKTREEVYQVSPVKFIKSLYNNSLKENGFLLATFHQHSDTLSFVNLDSILSPPSADKGKTLIIDNEHIMLVCYGKPIDNDSVMLYNWPALSLFSNLLLGDSIRIYPDGTYARKLVMSPVNSKRLTGLNMRLPLDYTSKTAVEVAVDEQKEVVDSIVQHFDRQLSIFPQEKIHLHTDRDYYVPGEKIWFKAYLVDAHTHTSLDSSRYVYAELISPADTVVSRVMIRPENGQFYGHIFLSEIIPEGNYTLRAYTKYMENLGDDYFFKKNIRIGSLSSSQFSVSSSQRENKSNRGYPPPERAGGGNPVGLNIGNSGKREDFDVTFYPEGGNLVEGVWNKVALKALNRSGYPETVTGVIVDENDNEITSIQTLHAGMGVFVYVPESGKRYYLKCRNENGMEKQFDLPKSDPRACALTVVQNNSRISVSIRKSPQSANSSFYLLAQCRGEALYFSEWDQKNDYLSFSADGFPSGIIQFVLFDAQMNPLSERLVFCKNFANDVENIEFHTDKESYGKREKVIATIQPPLTPPKEGNIPSLLGRVGVGLSVAVTDDRDIAPDSTTTILSSLLLTSELKGYIENPAWYLQDNIQSNTALDYLMMTHGWRRYNIPEIVKGNLETPQIPFQTSQQISGKVKGLMSRPVSDSKVIIVTEDGGYGMTSTDEKGAFKFQDFEYPDSASFMIQALSNWVKLDMDKESFPKPVHAPGPTPTLPKGEGVETDNYPSPHTNDFIAKAEQRAKYDEDMRVIYLDEVVVTAPRIDRKKEPRLEFWLNSSADYTVRREQMDKLYYPNLAQYLTLVPGVTVSPNANGMGTYTIKVCPLCGPPAILVDGIQVESLDYISPDMVESIDVLKYVNTTGLGVRGGNGIVSITTRKGGANTEIEKFNQTVYTPLGYQKPVEFYSPKYETLESKQLTIPDYRTTIFWKPDVVFSDEQEETSFEFYTSDFPTTYSVVIEGLTTDGKIVRQVEKIQVK